MDSNYTLVGFEGHFSEDEDDSDEAIDPRVKGELERLNSSTVEINRLEQELQDVQAAHRQTLTESAYVLKSQANHLGKCVEQARPYYQALDNLRESQIETQKAALRYENACNAHREAKEMVAFTEQRLSSPSSSDHRVLDPALQEMLNHATIRFMEAEQEKYRSEQEHLQIAQRFTKTERQMTEYKNKLKSSIIKSRSYFDLRSKYKLVLEGHKRKVDELQHYLAKAKKAYSLALKNLEEISEEIHEMRRSRDSLDVLLDKREQGVGAETPSDQSLCGSSSITRESCSSSSLSSISTSGSDQTYGFRVALVTKRSDECHLFPKGEGSQRSCGNADSLAIKMSCVAEEKYPDREIQNSSLTKVTVTTISDNEDVQCVSKYSDAHELVGYHQVDGKESDMETKSGTKPSEENNKVILHDRGSLQCSNSRGEQKQCHLKLVSIDKNINDSVSNIEEVVDESEVSTYHSMELDPSHISVCCDNPEAAQSKEVDMVSSKAESKVELISEKEHEKEKVDEHENTKIFNTVDKPVNAHNSGLQQKFEREDESKENEIENCDGPQNECNKILGSFQACEKTAQNNMADNKIEICQGGWGESNSLESIENVESQANFVCEIESDSEEDKNLGHQNAGFEGIIDSRIDNIQLSETESAIRAEMIQNSVGDEECENKKQKFARVNNKAE